MQTATTAFRLYVNGQFDSLYVTEAHARAASAACNEEGLRNYFIEARKDDEYRANPPKRMSFFGR